MLLDVPLNIYAISLRAHTQLVGVIFAAKVDPLKPDHFLPTPSLKNISLSTPKHNARASFSPRRWFPCLTSYIYCKLSMVVK